MGRSLGTDYSEMDAKYVCLTGFKYSTKRRSNALSERSAATDGAE
jgi:hypothetical protein